jgi:poly-gamma-glutamate synthesis protein (capsule biosynthesis protein)
MTPLLLLGDFAPAGLDRLEIVADPGVADALVVANLETPLCPAAWPAAPKAGPSLRADPALVPMLGAAFPRLALCLANNHSMDFGAAGLAATRTACAAQGIATFGAGETLAAARAPLRLRSGRREVVLLGACERQFGLAATDAPGVAPFGPGLAGEVTALRPAADRLIVSLHGASEMSPWPAPRWQQALRALIDAGADIVHGHHAHVPQGYERRGRGWIVYGAGNTLVNPSAWPEGGATLESWRFVFDLDDLAAAPEVSTWALTSPLPAHAKLAPAAHATARLAACNAPLADPALLEGLWQENACLLWQTFYRVGLGWSTPPTGLLRRGLHDLRRRLRTTVDSSGGDDQHAAERFLYHLFACEHHAEAIATALAVQAGVGVDRRTTRTAALAAAWLPGWREAMEGNA